MGKKGFQLKGLDPVFFTFHLLFLLITYSIYLAPHIAPSTFAYFGFIPLIYPLLVICNVLIIAFLFFRRINYAFLFLILSIGLYFPLTKTYQFFGKKIEETPNFKILTLNGHYFKTTTENEYISFFEKQDADVVVLQEVYWKGEKFENIQKNVFKDYYHEKHSIIQFFSKYPIIETKKILLGKDGEVAHAAYVDIDTGSDTVRIINLYLESMFIDKKLVINTIENTEKAEENSIIIKNKLVRGFLMHEKQIKQIIPYINQSRHPIILAGDFNAVPNSYEYQQFTHWLEDSYPKIGRSSGASFHGFKVPLRLDYILNSPEITATKIEVIRTKKLSDHYPVIGHFKLP